MIEADSGEYYQGREQQERVLAMTAVDPAIAAIHNKMADRYSELAEQAAPEPRPRLKLRAQA